LPWRIELSAEEYHDGRQDASATRIAVGSWV